MKYFYSIACERIFLASFLFLSLAIMAYSKPLVLIQTPCADVSGLGDCDGDGIINELDLDDDNDGVLDWDEYIGCLSGISSLPFAQVNIYDDGVNVNSTFSGLLLAIDGTINDTGLSSGTLTYANGGVNIEAIFSKPFNLAAFSFIIYQDLGINDQQGIERFSALKCYSENGNLLYTLSSIDNTNSNANNAAITYYNSPVTTGTLSGVIAPDGSVANANAIQIDLPRMDNLYRIVMEEVVPLSLSNSTQTMQIRELYIANFQKVQFCEADTDADGMSNHQDLDSDGDGCNDSFESGVPNYAGGSDIDNYHLNGSDIDGNGIDDAYCLGGSYTFTNAYDAYALLSTLNACVDTDGDGYTDALNDLDDDNDGILDSPEEPFTPCGYATDYQFSSYVKRANGYDIDATIKHAASNTVVAKIAVLQTSGPYSASTISAPPSTFISTAFGIRNANDNTTISSLYSGTSNVIIGGYTVSNNSTGNVTTAVITNTSNSVLTLSLTYANALGGYGVNNTNTQTLKYNYVKSAYVTDYNILIGGPTTSITSVQNPKVPISSGQAFDILKDISTSNNYASGTNQVYYGITLVLEIPPGKSSAIEMDCMGSGSAESWGFVVGSVDCAAQNAVYDLDQDGISNSLDTDTDGDRCLDALEGGANFDPSKIFNKQLTGDTDTEGIPTIALGGQALGTSQDINNKSVYCFTCTKLPQKQGTPEGTAIGIATVNEHTVIDWPMDIRNGFLALEAQTKGMVITRIINPELAIKQPVEGMLVWDSDELCLKLYKDTITGWKCIDQGCNE